MDLFVAWISFGSIFHLVIAIGFYLRKDRLQTQMYDSLASVSACILQMYVYCLYSGNYFSYPLLNHLYLPILWILPSLMKGSMVQLIREESYFKLRPISLLPFLLSIFFLLFSAIFKTDILLNTPIQILNDNSLGIIGYLTLAGSLYGLFTYFSLLYSLRVFFRKKNLVNILGVRVIRMILLGNLSFSLLIFLSFLFRWELGIYLAGFLASLMAVMGYLSSQKNPNLFRELLPEIRIAYRVSRIANINLDELNKNLNDLIERQKIYLEEDLTLAKFAGYLNIKDYQLSEYLNANCGMNFNRYINYHRVEEACHILASEPGANILSVAYKVGFNSKANFNLAFKSIKGISPREFLRSLK